MSTYINRKLEEFNKSIENKKIAIIGIGVSNIPLVEYFSKHNANVTVFDRKTLTLALCLLILFLNFS